MMQSPWEDTSTTGVLVRLNWDNIQPSPSRYDWSQLDREMNRAVATGKQFSVAVKAGGQGTPERIFNQGGVERISLQDWGSEESYGCNKPPCCEWKMDLGSPADPAYKQHISI
ncbi:MAG: hypothetical protein GWP91_05140 [Rhodobacterales bacterium]|nr:hypothetical protein [Rhodobacterales bacterium]